MNSVFLVRRSGGIAVARTVHLKMSEYPKKNLSKTLAPIATLLMALSSYTAAQSMKSVGLLGQDEGPQPLIVLPSEQYDGNVTKDLERASYPIENRRFIESVGARCFASTIMEDPKLYEPTFVVIKHGNEMRLLATSDPMEILSTGFRPELMTYIFVHGFTQSYPKTEWLKRVSSLFVENSLTERDNAIIMDWGFASNQSFSRSAAIVSGMGSFLANFIQKLIILKTDRKAIRLICHSLGAHVCGFAGKRIRPRIGRITALDMAGPCFGKVSSNGPNDRLTADDAHEVDVYHYDDDFLGIGAGQFGQFDVFVNGGSNQPGCRNPTDSFINAAVTVIFRRNRVLSESHTRSTEVATAQLARSGCQQVAYSCRNYAAFTHGECGQCDQENQQCFFMGFHFQYKNQAPQPLRVSFPGKKFYIATGSKDDYCLQHYQILLKFELNQELKQSSKGFKFVVTLANDQGGQTNATVTHRLTPNIFSHLLLLNAELSRVVSARVESFDSFGSPVPIRSANRRASRQVSEKNYLELLEVELNFMSNISPEVRSKFSSRLCAASSLIDESEDRSELQLVECRGLRGSLVR